MTADPLGAQSLPHYVRKGQIILVVAGTQGADDGDRSLAAHRSQASVLAPSATEGCDDAVAHGHDERAHHDAEPESRSADKAAARRSSRSPIRGTRRPPTAEALV